MTNTLFHQAKFGEAKAELEILGERVASDPKTRRPGQCLEALLSNKEYDSVKDEETLKGFSAPKAIRTFLPESTGAARRVRVSGEVILQAVMSDAGDVLCPHTLQSPPLHDLAAIAALEKWTFEPATFEGQPVDMMYDLPVDFALR